MTASRPRQDLLRHGANLLAPGLVFLPSFVAFVQFQGYPLWRPEVLMIAGLMLLVGVPFGLLLSWRPRTFGAAGVALLVLVLAMQVFSGGVTAALEGWGDLNQELSHWAGPLAGTALAVLVALSVLAVPLAVLSWLGPNLGLVLATVFSVAVASTVLLPAEPAPLGETYRRDGGTSHDLPPVIHLMLDGQIGIEGLPADIPGGDDVRDQLTRVYQDFGFTLYGRAFSEYIMTRHSMIALLNGFEALDGKIPKERDALPRLFWDNRWFKLLAERGYRLNVYHLQTWDFCGSDAGHAARCVAYSNGSIRSITDANITAGAKAKVILAAFLRSLVPYRTFRLLVRPTGGTPHMLPEQPMLFAPDSLDLLQQLLADIRAEPRGAAFFAHLLIPHYSHMMDADCRIRPDPVTWSSTGSLQNKDGMLNTAASRELRYGHYLAQVRCTHSAIRRFLEGLEEAGVLDDAIVVIHGDHGSRIARVAPLTTVPQPLSDRDMVDMYSVLFAARMPELAPGYRRGLVSVQALFREIFLGDPPQNQPAEVFFDYPATTLSRPIEPPFPRRPMIEFGQPPNSQ